MLRIDRAGGGTGTSSEVVWNPGAPADPAYSTTWAEVMTAFAESSGEFRVSLDATGGGAFTVPAGAYDLESRLQFSRPAPAEGQLTVSLADGAVLTDLAGVYRNITLELNPTVAPALELTSGRDIEFDVGAILDNQGSYAGLEVAAGETVGLRFYRGSRATATSDVIVDLTAATARLNATFEGDSQASTNWVSGVAGTTLDYRVDASYTPVTLASPPATTTTTLLDSYTQLSGLGGFSIPDYLSAAQTFVINAGSWTVGCAFNPTQEVTITGVRFYWVGAPARTIRCKIWSAAGAVLASVDQVTAGAGLYNGVFATPLVCPIENNGSYKASCWDTSATDYTRFASTPIVFPAGQFVNGKLIFRNVNAFAAGDANPTGSGVEFFAIAPIVQ